MGERHSLEMRAAIVCVLSVLHLLLVPPTVAYQQYNGCIFGDGVDCYFQCRCTLDTCDTLMGNCTPSDTCAEEDEVMLDYYPQEYSSGAACQVHNLAYKSHAVFNAHDLDEAAAVVPVRGDINRHFTTLTFDTAGEALVIVLEKMSNVEFIEVLLHPNHDIGHFAENFIVSLDTEIKTFSTNELGCTVTAHPFTLVKTLPNNINRVHYRCASPSTAMVVKITPYTELSFPYDLLLVRIVVVGHHYVDIDQLACLIYNGDDVFRWCKVCNGAYPPDCKRKCPTRNWGENCENTCSPNCSTGICDAMNGKCICQFGQCLSSTTLVHPTENEATYQSTQTTVVVGLPTNKETDIEVNVTDSSEDRGGILRGNMLVVVISVGGAIILVFIVVVTIILLCHNRHKKKQLLFQLLTESTGSEPPVYFNRNSPLVHPENNCCPSLYDEIPADQPNNHWQLGTSAEDPNMMPRYTTDPMGQVSSEYMTTDQVTEDSPYLEPYQLPSRPVASADNNNTGRIQGYEPLRGRDIGQVWFK